MREVTAPPTTPACGSPHCRLTWGAPTAASVAGDRQPGHREQEAPEPKPPVTVLSWLAHRVLHRSPPHRGSAQLLSQSLSCASRSNCHAQGKQTAASRMQSMGRSAGKASLSLRRHKKEKVGGGRELQSPRRAASTISHLWTFLRFSLEPA